MTNDTPEAVAARRPITDEEVLICTLAAVLDHPSLYMGGPSQQSLRTAKRLVPIIKEYAAAILTTEPTTTTTMSVPDETKRCQCTQAFGLTHNIACPLGGTVSESNYIVPYKRNRPTITPAGEEGLEFACHSLSPGKRIVGIVIPDNSGPLLTAEQSRDRILASLRSTPPAAGEEVTEADKTALSQDVLLSIPAYLHKSIFKAFARHRLATRSADVAELRAALEPFARFGAMWLGPPTEVILRGVDRSELTIADLRRARAALTGQPVTPTEDEGVEQRRDDLDDMDDDDLEAWLGDR